MRPSAPAVMCTANGTRRRARTSARSIMREAVATRCMASRPTSEAWSRFLRKLVRSYQSPSPRRLFVAMNILAILLVVAQQRPLTGLDAYVSKAMTDWRVPGLAIVVVKDDSVVFIKGYGVRELGKPEPVTVHTRFGNMSTTKAFTAMLVAVPAASGRVAFDDPVTNYEPGVQFSDPYVTREITVRDLLTHSLGFGDPDYLWGTSGLDFPA